jgi:hypothetical protein
LKGWIAVADIEGEQPKAMVGGTFAEDDEYGFETSRQGLEALFGGHQKKNQHQRPLPRGLRRRKKVY